MSAPEKPSTGSKPPGEAARPFSIRLTEDERRLLLERAGRLPLGTYIRDLILPGDGQEARRRWANPIKDHEALARVLAALGQSRLSNNLNQLAKAVNVGVLPVTPETEDAIRTSCADVSTMRRDLVCALGLSDGRR